MQRECNAELSRVPGNRGRDDLFKEWIPGVLSGNQVRQLFEAGWIKSEDSRPCPAAIDTSSFDLTLSDEAYRMLSGSVKPQRGQRYLDLLRDNKLSELMKPEGSSEFHLERAKTYVFKLRETLDPELANHRVYGQATAKSSVGRVDVLARLIVDGMDKYEYFDPEGLREGDGSLYLEVTPITFPVSVRPGFSLSQLRLFYGPPEDSVIRSHLLFRCVLPEVQNPDGSLTVDLTSVDSVGGCAFVAQSSNNLVPIRLEDNNPDKPDPHLYWEIRSADRNRLQIEPGRFYILRSKERIAVPKGIAVYCRATDETIGEMRIHYAGFAHPWFGRRRRDGKIGTPLIFEVRGHHVPVNLADGERMAHLIFYRMSEDAEEPSQGEAGPYEEQELALSKYFRPWG